MRELVTDIEDERSRSKKVNLCNTPIFKCSTCCWTGLLIAVVI